MADELPAGSVNLEDDSAPAPAAGAAGSAEADAAGNAGAAGTSEPAPEATIEVVDGDQRVPLAALLAARADGKALKERAARVEALEAELQQARPYVEFLKANPQVLQQPKAEPTRTEPTVDPDAEEAARLMDFYKPDGSIDAERGAKWLALQDRRASRLTEAAVKPFQQQSLQERAQANFQRALGVKNASGETPSRESLAAIWQTLPADITSDPAAAQYLALMALGADQFRPKAPAKPASEPLHTEASGGAARPAVALSAMEQRIAAQRGVKASDWQELTKTHVPGRATVLED